MEFIIINVDGLFIRIKYITYSRISTAILSKKINISLIAHEEVIIFAKCQFHINPIKPETFIPSNFEM